METVVVELTAEQMDALTAALASVALYARVSVVCIVTCGFFLAFEIAAIVFWLTVFRE